MTLASAERETPEINRDALTIYLSDHLAGSVAALELMGRICRAHTDTPLGAAMTTLSRDVEADQQALRDLLAHVGGTASKVTATVAWLGEKISRVKLSADPDAYDGVKLFEALESLTLGFSGRIALWEMLETLRDSMACDLDFARLAREAQAQRAVLERQRIEAGRAALIMNGALPST